MNKPSTQAKRNVIICVIEAMIGMGIVAFAVTSLDSYPGDSLWRALCCTLLVIAGAVLANAAFEGISAWFKWIDARLMRRSKADPE